MTRHPWPDTMPVDKGAEALIARLAAGGRRPQPLDLPPKLRAEAARRYAEVQGPEPAGERDRTEQMLVIVLLLWSALGVVALVAAVFRWLA